VSYPAADHSRRQALKIGGAVLALVIGGGAGWLDRRGNAPSPTRPPPSRPGQSSTTTSTDGPQADNVSADLIGSLDTRAIAALDPAIADLGRRYLATNPAEADLAILLGLLDNASEPADKSAFDPITAATRLIAAEFRRGDTVSVEGWVLAASEARAAAVVALLCVNVEEGSC